MQGIPENLGIIPLTVDYIFDHIKKSDREFLLRVSYMEIYNEEIGDLLSNMQKLKVHHDVKRGIYVGHLKEEIITSKEQVLDLMDLGQNNRKIGETGMNEKSSRSHSIFKIIIESRDRLERKSTGAVKVSTLNLVDLAGSERISNTKAEGMRKIEGAHINKSLLGKFHQNLFKKFDFNLIFEKLKLWGK